MNRTHTEPPPLIPIFDVEDDDNDTLFHEPRITHAPQVKYEPDYSYLPIQSIHRSSQLDSPISLDGNSNEESSVKRQDERCAIQSSQNDLVPLPQNTISKASKRKRSIETVRNNQSITVSPSTVNPPSSVASQNAQCQSDTHPGSGGRSASAAFDETNFDPRVRFLVSDPMLLQDMLFKEKCRTGSNEIDPELHLHQFHVVDFQRLRRLYHLGLIHVRLDGIETRRIVFAHKSIDLDRILPSSCEINEFTLDWTDVPAIITELISTFVSADSPSRYLMLFRDSVYKYWELIDYLGPLSPPVSPTKADEQPTFPTSTDEEVLTCYVLSQGLMTCFHLSHFNSRDMLNLLRTMPTIAWNQSK